MSDVRHDSGTCINRANKFLVLITAKRVIITRKGLTGIPDVGTWAGQLSFMYSKLEKEGDREMFVGGEGMAPARTKKRQMKHNVGMSYPTYKCKSSFTSYKYSCCDCICDCVRKRSRPFRC